MICVSVFLPFIPGNGKPTSILLEIWYFVIFRSCLNCSHPCAGGEALRMTGVTGCLSSVMRIAPGILGTSVIVGILRASPDRSRCSSLWSTYA